MRSCSGHSGHGVCGERSAGGCGRISNCITDSAFCRWQVPRQSAPGVAAADDHHALTAGENRLEFVDAIAQVAAILLRQKLHRKVDALQFAPRHVQIARLFGASGQQDRIEVVPEIVNRARFRRRAHR